MVRVDTVVVSSCLARIDLTTPSLYNIYDDKPKDPQNTHAQKNANKFQFKIENTTMRKERMKKRKKNYTIYTNKYRSHAYMYS